jgi:hypothetical protein
MITGNAIGRYVDVRVSAAVQGPPRPRLASLKVGIAPFHIWAEFIGCGGAYLDSESVAWLEHAGHHLQTFHLDDRYDSTLGQWLSAYAIRYAAAPWQVSLGVLPPWDDFMAYTKSRMEEGLDGTHNWFELGRSAGWLLAAGPQEDGGLDPVLVERALQAVRTIEGLHPEIPRLDLESFRGPASKYARWVQTEISLFVGRAAEWLGGVLEE